MKKNLQFEGLDYSPLPVKSRNFEDGKRPIWRRKGLICLFDIMEILKNSDFINLFILLETKCGQWKDDERAIKDFESGEMLEIYRTAESTLTELGFYHSAELAAEEVQVFSDPNFPNYISNNYNTNHFRNRMNIVILDIARDFKRTHLLNLSRIEAKLFVTTLPFGQKVALKFPQLQEDAIEAARCYSVGRYTGTVFHLMRVMELITQHLAFVLGVTPIDKHKPMMVEDATLNKLLDGINAEIKKREAAGPSAAEKKLLKQYSNVYIHLDHVRRVWRNPVAHPHEFFNRLEAKNILNLVRQFVISLIEVL